MRIFDSKTKTIAITMAIIIRQQHEMAMTITNAMSNKKKDTNQTEEINNNCPLSALQCFNSKHTQKKRYHQILIFIFLYCLCFCFVVNLFQLGILVHLLVRCNIFGFLATCSSVDGIFPFCMSYHSFSRSCCSQKNT